MNLSLSKRFEAVAGLRSMAALMCVMFSASVVAQQVCHANIPLTRPDSRYEAVAGTAVAGSEVRDKVTGLIWQRCLVGTSWDGAACTGTYTRHTWQEALQLPRSAVASTALPATTWRLPNRNELRSLVDTACIVPSLNTSWFPNALGSLSYRTWTSSPVESEPREAIYVEFERGSDFVALKNTPYTVRLVRSGQ